MINRISDGTKINFIYIPCNIVIQLIKKPKFEMTNKFQTSTLLRNQYNRNFYLFAKLVSGKS
jgi:hypothetical protein